MSEEAPTGSDRQKLDDTNNPTVRRDRMWEQGARLIALMHGGAAVALLAFVQAIWKDAPELVGWVAAGLVAFALGLALASVIPLIREVTVLNWKSNEGKARKYQSYYRRAASLSVMFFLSGVAIVAFGILINLPQ